MIKDKISIQEIIDLVASRAGVSKRASEEFLKVFIATIEDTLIAGESVKIKDFGTFKLQWNAPRKSVNIKTGDEILLSGYYKVTFTPENTLKELVNEPFAHLEAIILNGSSEEVVQEDAEAEVELNPLRIFEEQASEIKSLLSEIQALSPNSKPISILTISANSTEIINEIEISTNAEVSNADVEKNSEDINYIDEIENENIEETIDTSSINTIVENNQTNNQIIEAIEQSASESFEDESKINKETEPFNLNVTESKSTSNPFIETSKSKSRKQLVLIITTVLLLGGGVSSYFFFPPATDLVNRTLNKGENFVLTFKDSASTTDLLNMISKWFIPKSKEQIIPETVIVPKATVQGDSIIEEELVDSLQVLFDTPRVYPEYIATEKIVSGSRLARMSERYYGKSDFWVYIYEANQNRIPNPDNIPSGTLIYIPKVDPRLIDATNPRCLKKARELHDLYVKTDAAN